MDRWRLGGAALAAVLALVLAAGEAAACARPQGWTGAARIDGERWSAWWRSEPAAIPLGAHFSIRFRLCGPPVGRVGVRGWMPDHRHGMNYRPAVTLNGPSGKGRGPAVPHAGALAADPGCPRRGGPGEADRRNGAGVTPRRSGATVAAGLSGVLIAACALSGLAQPAPASRPHARGRTPDPAPRSVAARPAARSQQPGLRQAGRHRLRPGAVLRSAPVVLGHGLLRNLPPARAGLDRRPAAQPRAPDRRPQRAQPVQPALQPLVRLGRRAGHAVGAEPAAPARRP